VEEEWWVWRKGARWEEEEEEEEGEDAREDEMAWRKEQVARR